MGCQHTPSGAVTRSEIFAHTMREGGTSEYFVTVNTTTRLKYSSTAINEGKGHTMHPFPRSNPKQESTSG